MDPEHVLDVCIEAVRAGARVASRAQADWLGRSVSKEDKSPVTVADFATQITISHHLFRAFPDAKLIAEENVETFRKLSEKDRLECLARVQYEIPEIVSEEMLCALVARGDFENLPEQSDAAFVLDPIDGTKGYIRGEQYAVCLGLISADGAPTCGVIACPNLWGEEGGYLFEAHVGCGNVTRMRRLADNALLREFAKPEATELIFTESYEKSHMVEGGQNVLLARCAVTGAESKVIRIDSQTKYALLVRGDATVYARITPFEQCIWDVLPGAVILQQAGGRISDEFGNALNFKTGRTVKNKTLLSTRLADAKMHDALVKLLQ